MAEKGILINDQAGGESVACRDALENDESANARIIQIMDKAARPVNYSTITALRTVFGNDSDSLDVSPADAGISGNLLEVSDAESVLVWAIITKDSGSSADMEVTVTPMIFTDGGEPDTFVVALPPLQMRPIIPEKAANAGVITQADILQTTNATGVVAMQSFPTYGAINMGFHIFFVNGDSAAKIELFAAPSSCTYRDYQINKDLQGDIWGSSTDFRYTGGG